MRPGEVVEVDQSKAVEMIRGGYAEAVAVTDVHERSVAMVMAPEARTKALLDVAGIGEASACALIEMGILTAAELAEADAATIAKALPGVGKVTAARWIEAARDSVRA